MYILRKFVSFSNTVTYRECWHLHLYYFSAVICRKNSAQSFKTHQFVPEQVNVSDKNKTVF